MLPLLLFRLLLIAIGNESTIPQILNSAVKITVRESVISDRTHLNFVTARLHTIFIFDVKVK